MKEIMKNPEFKKYGKDINKILPKILSNIGKFSVPFESQEKEMTFWTQVQDLLNRKFNLQIILQNETIATDPKKNQALPGKPAIIIN